MGEIRRKSRACIEFSFFIFYFLFRFFFLNRLFARLLWNTPTQYTFKILDKNLFKILRKSVLFNGDLNFHPGKFINEFWNAAGFSLLQHFTVFSWIFLIFDFLNFLHFLFFFYISIFFNLIFLNFYDSLFLSRNFPQFQSFLIFLEFSLKFYVLYF